MFFWLSVSYVQNLSEGNRICRVVNTHFDTHWVNESIGRLFFYLKTK